MTTNQLRQLRVILVGGTGFLGPHVAAQLLRMGHRVIVYHRGEHEPALPYGIEHVHSPLAARPVTRFPSELTSLACDVVVGMHVMGEADARAIADSFRGIARRAVLISSADVYRAYGVVRGTEPGPPDPAPLSEDSPLRERLYPYRDGSRSQDPNYVYEKILAEREIARHRDLPATILRLPAVYGPGDEQRRFFPYLRRMQDRRPAIVLEKGMAAWRWTHGYVENIAHAIALVVDQDKAAGRVYNVGEPVTSSTEERVLRLARVTGWEGRIVALPAESCPPHLRLPGNFGQRIELDSSRIREELGYKEPVSEQDAFRRTISWERANPPAHLEPALFDYEAEDRALGETPLPGGEGIG
jgi:nucleoside-diphosphate-sugar epimerase